MSNPARVMMVDDHPLFRKGLMQLFSLEPRLELVAEASSGAEAVKLADECDPDLILLDLNMRGMDGLDTLRTMRAAGVSARIVMLTVSDNNADVVACIRAGADGYLLKDMDPEDILEQVLAATHGKMAISQRLTEILASALRKPDQSGADTLSTLTSREYQILQLIADGLSNKLIARELDISDATVKVHVKHLLKKLGMRSRVEAAVWMVNQKRAESR
ncbi:two-component system response regulator NarL [Microbulbifer thermotolerans]|uniref:DNA-binding response regulator n=1 Tax=Microbulbifer thermotolerans TaxID=252514 RepID=A0A143HK45_MICTH|nr:two-component system response regulator NarL [Microbulbifer thermotolerans]AMX01840.1 DNA-binding response regulator [Microbulbifer thermotolerans]MCX2783982.1 two-component system response regulator NarL [Microbulbifer thermotolerans]MCX2793503.1 two-component system response regulator NarL [Microbulbifer thermotolerans]MCX2802696.1 two-component system response regulator NarL [Microbulbifer thermotolerans]MCX2830459.1 two-component system response regulator NarL [Microbulbifer thermotoler